MDALTPIEHRCLLVLADYFGTDGLTVLGVMYRANVKRPPLSHDEVLSALRSLAARGLAEVPVRYQDKTWEAVHYRYALPF